MRKIVVLIVTGILVISTSFQAVYAYNFDGEITKSGTYTFASNEAADINLTDTFEYRDDCFRIEASEGCCHLAKLSAKVCEASVGNYSDPDMKDASKGSANIEAMLSDMGFSGVKTNKYYNKDKLRNSIGCVAGHRKLTDGDKEYTILAVFPECAGYKQEWCGNLTVGKDGLHQGFREARDEVLRFVRKYVEEQGITGDVKVWTAGHSRGAAVANLLGGFLVEGADGYFDGISIAPENVYCYTFGTPQGVLSSGLTKGEALSVSGPRGGAYSDDTPGAAYVYRKADAGDTIDPHSGVYAGLHTFGPGYDLYAQLALTDWGFTSYGTQHDLEEGVSKSRMLEELAAHSDFAYNEYRENDRDDCTYYTVNINAIGTGADVLVPDTDAGSLTQTQLVQDRLDALTALVKDRDEYVEGDYQEALAAAASTYAMVWHPFMDALMPESGIDYASFAVPAATTYLAYASDRLQKEGRAQSESEAAAIALVDLAEYLTGTDIPSEAKVDDVVYTVLKYILDPVHKDENDNFSFDSKLAETIFDTVAKMLSGKEPADDEELDSVRSTAYALLSPLVYDPETGKADQAATKENRTNIYMSLPFMLPAEYQFIAYAIGDGNGSFTDFIKTVYPDILRQMLGKETIDSAADDSLRTLVVGAYQKAIDAGLYAKDSEQYNNLIYYRDTLDSKMPVLRKAVTYFLFYEDGKEFDTASIIRNAATFAGNGARTLVTHYKESYVAWMMARECKEHEPEESVDPGKKDRDPSGGDNDQGADSGDNDGGSGSNKADTHVRTGDDNHLGFWIILALTSALAMGSMLVIRRWRD